MRPFSIRSSQRDTVNIALLDIQTDQAFDKPGDNFLVGRYSRDVLKRSRVGAIFVNKESGNGSAHYNRAFGADANFALGSNMQVTSFLAKTATPRSGGGEAVLSWALAVLGKRQRCVRMHEAGPYQRLKRTEPIAPVSTAAR